MTGGFRIGRPQSLDRLNGLQLQPPLSKEAGEEANLLLEEGCRVARSAEKLDDPEKRAAWRQKALSALAKAQTIAPEHPEINWALGRMHWTLENFERALYFANRAHERMRDREGIDSIRDLRLRIYESLGDKDEVQRIRDEKEADVIAAGELTENMTSTFLNLF